MIQNIKDRVPVNVLSNDAIRYGIYDEQGNLIRYEYIKREDEPVETGTPINRALFSNLQGDLYTQDRYNKPVVEYGEIDEPILVERDIMPKSWTKISATEYHADDGTILTVSSVYGTDTPDRMFDDNTETDWINNTANKSWAKIEFPTAKKITKMATYLRSVSAGLSSAKILGSNDDETWNDLYEFTKWQESLEVVTLQNPDFYKFYKIEVILASSSRFQIYEWQTYEYYETKNYINKLLLPLASYEKGKIVNIEGSSCITEEASKTGNIFPTSWNVETTGTKYSSSDGYILEASSIYGTTGTYTNFACDGDSSTHWTSADTLEKWIKMTLPKDTKITRMIANVTAGSPSGMTTKIEGSKNDTDWVTLYTFSGYNNSNEELILSNTDYYKYYRIIITHTSSQTGIVNEWQTSAYKAIDEDVEVTSFEKPHININNLGAKQINGTIQAGEKYSLIYNGESWDIQRDYVFGAYTGDGSSSQFIALGFTPSAVIVYPTSAHNNSYTALGTTRGSQGYIGKFQGLATQFYAQRTFAGPYASSETISIAQKGFNVYYVDSDTSYYGSYTNVSDMTYQYIAFK